MNAKNLGAVQTVYLKTGKNYALNICNATNRPVYLFDDMVGVQSGLLLIPGTMAPGTRNLFNRLNLQFGVQRETQTVGMYVGRVTVV